MKHKDMPSVKARDYAAKHWGSFVDGPSGSLDRMIRNRLERAFMTGYALARKRFAKVQS